MAFSGVKKQKKNELTVRSGSNPKKKERERKIRSQKKKKTKRNELTVPFAQEPFVRLCPFVRVPILKKKRKKTLITFSKVKKSEKQKKRNELTVPFAQEPFVRLCPFVRVPILKKRKENVNYVL